MLNVSEMSDMILECMYFFLLASSFGKKGHFPRYSHPHIITCALSHYRDGDDRLLCDIEISGKTQNSRLKSVCHFKVTRFYLTLLCKQHNWTLGSYSI